MGNEDGEHQVAADAWGRAGLTPAQQTFVRSVLPDVELVADHSWGLLDTVVLHVRSGGRDLVVKACGPQNTHFPRELTAHRGWTDVLVARGDAGALVAADEDTRVLVLDRVPGRLALGTPDEHDPAVHRQAGALLRRLHDQTARTDPTYAEQEQAKTTAQLDRRHRIPAERVEAVRAVLARFRPTPVTVVPTHGDWQPRNWVVDDGRLRAIDLGRFAFRPRRTSHGSPSCTGSTTRRSRPPSSTGTGAIPGPRTRGAGSSSARPSAPRCGHTRWVTPASRSRGTGCSTTPSLPSRADGPGQRTSRGSGRPGAADSRKRGTAPGFLRGPFLTWCARGDLNPHAVSSTRT